MAEQGKIVMPTVIATGRRQQSSNEIYNESYRESNGGSTVSDRMTGHPSRTCFTSNQRPAVNEPILNLTGNPQFGFLSQTERENQLHAHLGSLPNLINKPHTHQLRSDSTTAPAEKKTEYQSLFVSHPLTATVLPDQVMDSKPKTGFTEGTDLQLYTFKEKNSSTGEPHQIYSSVTKIDFVPPPLQQSTEVVPGLYSRSFRESGYTRGVIAPVAWPSSLLPLPQTKSRAPPLKTIGKKEPTGFLRNVPSNQVFPKTSFEPSNFITHNQMTFFHRGDLNKLNSADSAGIISAKKSSSYHRHNQHRFIL